jgi:hypothetical protein
VDYADQLRIGPWVPEPGRHSGSTGTDEITSEHLPQRPGADGSPAWLRTIVSRDDDWDDGGGRHRGGRRAGELRAVLVTIPVLVVAVAAIMFAVSPSPRAGYGAQRVTGVAASQTVRTGLPATYEADAPANTLTGSAHSTTYPNTSDGMIVRTIGNWGTAAGDGALRFNNVVVPGSGVYILTFYYAHPNNEPTRTVVITASGFDSAVITVTGTATCCSAQTLRVILDKGSNSITFSNPNGHAPAIDKIVIKAL